MAAAAAAAASSADASFLNQFAAAAAAAAAASIQGGNSKGFFGPKNSPNVGPKTVPTLEVPFEEDTCINFQFRMFRAAFRTDFTTVVPFLIHLGQKLALKVTQKPAPKAALVY